MKPVKLEQNSDEWKAFRKTRIGASDVPIIMGHSPYTTAYQLYMEKKGARTRDVYTWAMQQGHRAEEQIAKTLEQRIGEPTVPMCATHDKHDWLMASFDGVSLENDVIAEFKYNSEKNHNHVKKHGAPVMPHWLQVQAQLMVCGFDKAYYCSYHHKSNDTVIVEVFADKVEQKRIFSAVYKFYQNLLTCTAPEMDIEERTDDSYSFAIKSYENAKMAFDAADCALTCARKALLEIVKRPCKGFGYKITATSRRGLIDYKNIPQVQALNLENFRKPTTVQWSIKEIKEDNDIG